MMKWHMFCYSLATGHMKLMMTVTIDILDLLISMKYVACMCICTLYVCTV